MTETLLNPRRSSRLFLQILAIAAIGTWLLSLKLHVAVKILHVLLSLLLLGYIFFQISEGTLIPPVQKALDYFLGYGLCLLLLIDFGPSFTSWDSLKVVGLLYLSLIFPLMIFQTIRFLKKESYRSHKLLIFCYFTFVSVGMTLIYLRNF